MADSEWKKAWRLLIRRPTALVGLFLILVFAIMAIFAPWIAPYGYQEQFRRDNLQGPSSKYLLGTDELGRDTLSRIIYGSRISFSVGLIAVGIGVVLGLILGSISGYLGGWVDYCIVGLIDMVYSFPILLLAIALTAILQPGIQSAMIALGLVSWPIYARIVRSQFLSFREREFVESARALGANHIRIIIRHILPNILGPVLVVASLGMGVAILVEASLSYIGLGAQPPQPSWGSMLNAGRNFMYQAPLMSIAPGMAIVLLVLSFNLFGDALRDALDPKLRK